MTHVYEQPLYLYEAGSRLTGTSIATSDSDMIEVRGEPIESLLGIGPEMKATQIKRDGADVAIQPLRKFVSLLAQGNPNMVQGLFVPPPPDGGADHPLPAVGLPVRMRSQVDDVDRALWLGHHVPATSSQPQAACPHPGTVGTAQASRRRINR